MQRDAASSTLVLGEKAPYFSLRGTDGRIYSNTDFQLSKAFVVIFTCNHCPYAQAYEGRLCELAEEFQPQGAQFVAICANDAQVYPEDDFEHMVSKSEEWANVFPYLQDETQVCARAYDAACTPEAYVFDAEQRLRYHGRIDDNHQNPLAVEHPDLRLAVEAVLQRKEPPHPLTVAVGCSIKWKN